MPLRQRMTLVAAVAVGVAVIIVAFVSYVVVRGQLRSQVDGALKDQASLVQQTRGRSLMAGNIPGLPATAGGSAPYWQIVAVSGAPLVGGGGISIPDDALVSAVANGRTNTAFEDLTVRGVHLRLYAFHETADFGDGQITPVAVALARPLGPTDRVLSKLRLILILLCAAGVALAAGLGRLASRRVLAPLAEVAETAQHISETEDLSSRIHVHADDEVGQLATRFNAMIERLQSSRDALDESARAQRQLVADASHELRTPVTSLRTNIEVLLAGVELAEEDRNRLLADVVEQSEELSALVGDLIELARGDLPLDATESTRLDRIVEESVARARRNAPQIRFEPELHPVVLEGVPERLGRAVNNLLDNAARHSPAGETVEVFVDTAGVRVRDHGTGIAESDLPYVFDRFFRGTNSRGRQGSGLGLAIVRQVAQQHGGSVSAENAPGGGALLTLRLPGAPAEAAPAAHDAALTPEESPAPVPGGRR